RQPILLCAVMLIALAATACGELEPLVEPEIIDLQLTLDTLRTQLRDAQRNLAEVRAELEARRQELADAQVARAQLEGRVREAERRVSEARHVIDVQREELLAARAERERVFRSSSKLHSQMRQYQKRTAKHATPPAATTEPTGSALPTGASFPWLYGDSSLSATPAVNAFPPQRAATAAAMSQDPSVREIIVKPGDTLWSLARKYRVGLNRLRAINDLTDDQIEAGQILLLNP
ncbi:MAG TPA: LysM peptidoglycan-binding domain-containing protein, partial [Nitrospira sp.]|nr:LysM peptidoglycan-binding domain-containing protein [Nitrospira sp.]